MSLVPFVMEKHYERDKRGSRMVATVAYKYYSILYELVEKPLTGCATLKEGEQRLAVGAQAIPRSTGPKFSNHLWHFGEIEGA